MSNGLTYAQIWDAVKRGSAVKITVSRFNIPSIKRMISKHKDGDAEYKLMNPYKARLNFSIIAKDGELHTLKIELKQYPSSKSLLLE